MSPARTFVARLSPVLGAAGILAGLDSSLVLSIHAPTVFFGSAIALGVLTMTAAGSIQLRMLRLILVVLCSVVISAIDWTTQKRFIRAVSSLEVGMSEPSVREAMTGFIEGTGWPINPLELKSEAEDAGDAGLKIPGTLVFRPSTTPGDSTWAIVRFGANGQVVSVRFSPD